MSHYIYKTSTTLNNKLFCTVINYPTSTTAVINFKTMFTDSNRGVPTQFYVVGFCFPIKHNFIAHQGFSPHSS